MHEGWKTTQQAFFCANLGGRPKFTLHLRHPAPIAALAALLLARCVQAAHSHICRSQLPSCWAKVPPELRHRYMVVDESRKLAAMTRQMRLDLRQ